MKLKLVFILVSGCIRFLVFSQETNYSFVNYNYKDGFPEKYVYSITQDKAGTIWLGTGTGLYQFDGIKFNKINSPEDNSQHQAGNILLNVYTDCDGKIWLVSLNAIQQFDPRNHRFKSVNYQDHSIQTILQSEPFQTIRDSEKNLWIATRKNFWFRFETPASKQKKQFIPRHAKINAESKVINRIISLPDGRNFAFSNNGIFAFDGNNVTGCYFYSAKGNSLVYNGFHDAKRNCIWLACGSSGIKRFDLKTKTFVSYSSFSSKENIVTLVMPKSPDEIWFGANTLGIFHISENTIQSFPVETSNDFTYRKFPLSYLFNDRENNLWLASFNGLSMLPWQNTQIKKLPLTNLWANYTLEPYGVFADGFNYYVLNNTSNGLLSWDISRKKWALIEIPSLKGQYKKINGIISIVKNNQSVCFAASMNKLFTLDLHKKALTPYLIYGKPVIIQGEIQQLFCSTNDLLFIQTTKNGFYKIDLKAKTIRHFSRDEIVRKTKKTSSGNIVLKLIDQQNRLWFTETNGVYMFDSRTDEFRHLANLKSQNNGTSIQESIDITQEAPGSFWISTHENGIYHFIFKNGKQQLYNYNQTNTELPSNYCQNLAFDASGMLWIGTLNGLVKFNTQKNAVISVLGQQHGLKENNAIIPMNIHANGDLTLSYYGELSVLNTRSYQSNFRKPHILFSSLKVLDRSVKTNNTGPIVLQPDETLISFHYYSTSYTNSQQIVYRYRLTNHDKVWRTTSFNEISYSNLNSGNHLFQLQARNNDGVWGPVTQLKIEVLAPFWKRPVVYIAAFVLLLLTGLFFYRRKLRQIRHEERLKSSFETKIAQLEMKAMRAQMNPHFIFNSLNSIQKYLLQNDGVTASKYLSKFSKLIRLILENSNQQNIVLQDEIDLMQLYIEIESMRFNEQFDYFIEIDKAIQTELITIPSMIIQPYIENAIWHGLLHKESKGILKLEIKLIDSNSISVLIEDNGVGREKAGELKSKNVLKNKSYGMKITADRIDLINAILDKETAIIVEDLFHPNGESAGTRIRLSIPFIKLNSNEDDYH